MSHSLLFCKLARTLRTALMCERRGLDTRTGLALRDQMEERLRAGLATRREFLATLGGVAAASGLATVAPSRRVLAAPPRGGGDVGIVGAGIAGLTCSDTLRQAGLAATIYEARDRVGGRIWSMGGSFPGPVIFPGQVVERGGELIDNWHKTMLGYAQKFNLAKEDMTKEWLLGGTTFFVDGQHVPEEVIVEEYRELVAAMRGDLTRLSVEVTALSFTDFDRKLDFTSLAEYLDTRGAAHNIRVILDTTYNIEYGCEINELSCLAFLFFIHADRRSRFQPFGVFSDERWHIVDGNEQITRELAARQPGPFEMEAWLVRVSKLSDGRIELTLKRDGKTLTRAHDAVVLAIPFSTLRNVELDDSLGLPPEKRVAIAQFGYGTNAKYNVGFVGRFWGAQGSDGTSYSNLPNHQTTWEPNPSRATVTDAVLLDYSGGLRGARLRESNQEVLRWLTDLDKVYPGALAAAKRVGNDFLAHLQHWPSDPYAKGSYTCNKLGYFTTIEGHQATPVGNLVFAGEHTDKFSEAQGFMEGAATSGIRAAGEILASLK